MPDPSPLHALAVAISGGTLLFALAEIAFQLWRNRARIAAGLAGDAR